MRNVVFLIEGDDWNCRTDQQFACSKYNISLQGWPKCIPKTHVCDSIQNCGDSSNDKSHTCSKQCFPIFYYISIKWDV